MYDPQNQEGQKTVHSKINFLEGLHAYQNVLLISEQIETQEHNILYLSEL